MRRQRAGGEKSDLLSVVGMMTRPSIAQCQQAGPMRAMAAMSPSPTMGRMQVVLHPQLLAALGVPQAKAEAELRIRRSHTSRDPEIGTASLVATTTLPFGTSVIAATRLALVAVTAVGAGVATEGVATADTTHLEDRLLVGCGRVTGSAPAAITTLPSAPIVSAATPRAPTGEPPHPQLHEPPSRLSSGLVTGTACVVTTILPFAMSASVATLTRAVLPLVAEAVAAAVAVSARGERERERREKHYRREAREESGTTSIRID